MSDAEQLLVWKAALALSDKRYGWPRAMRQAIGMIEKRDRKIVAEQKRILAESKDRP